MKYFLLKKEEEDSSALPVATEALTVQLRFLSVRCGDCFSVCLASFCIDSSQRVINSTFFCSPKSPNLDPSSDPDAFLNPAKSQKRA